MAKGKGLRVNQIFAGMRHGNLTVIRRAEDTPTSGPRFECKCDCGAIAIIRGSHFYLSRQYCSNQCPLLQKARIGDLSGQRFGHWTVQGFDRIDQNSLWKCRCDCGNEKSIPAGYLTAGRTKSCGDCDLWKPDHWAKTEEERRERRRAIARKSAYARPARMKANKIKHDMQQAYATPLWLTKEHWLAMDRAYKMARRLTKQTGIAHQVDHIIPLQGKTVNGLHVPWNLQVITQAENVAKSNRYAEHHGNMVS